MTAPSRPPRSTPRSPTGCARNSITRARPRICGSTAKSSRTSPGSRCRGRSPELSTRRLLTMTWLDGEPILDIAEKAPLEVRNEIALRMFRIWYVPFYYYGVIHGDPHLGNYTVAPGTHWPHRQPARFRLRPGVPGELRQGRHRPLPRAASATTASWRSQAYHSWGFRRSVARDDRGAEPLGRVCLRAAARRPDPDDPGESGAGAPTAARLVDSVHRTSAGWRHRAAARLCLHGPRRDRTRLGVSAPAGQDQLAPRCSTS